MSTLFANVNEQALQIDPDEKWALIESLLISLDHDPDESPADISAAWNAEISRRVEAMDRGDTRWMSADEFFERLRNRPTQPD